MNESPGTWIAVGLAAVSMIGTAITGIVAAVVKVAQIRADVKTATLEAQNAVQAKQITTLESDHATCKETSADALKKLNECEEKHKTTEVRLDQIEAALGKK